MKKTKEPGGNISLKTKKNEDPAIMQWLNAQSNLMDSIRYLIENEIRQNGVRNLQAFVPAERAFGASSQPLSNTGVPVESAAAFYQEAAAGIEEPETQASEPPVEDDIDDEDIESWT
ncbi:hypothetical protein [Paenibacillus spongiae]|uniref:Uncharacterized protein n=1 Tax=Paenibacillus spongiae TaxID=2909671 RepID=A0ABY5SC51_9BACL|nr:hypothetical protein [Paenibacillus spongiae]UVI30090.1 hypothetical protein L1F29_32745 [Paenibacillus spongiae]